jgi:hypothetical protein
MLNDFRIMYNRWEPSNSSFWSMKEFTSLVSRSRDWHFSLQWQQKIQFISFIYFHSTATMYDCDIFMSCEANGNNMTCNQHCCTQHEYQLSIALILRIIGNVTWNFHRTGHTQCNNVCQIHHHVRHFSNNRLTSTCFLCNLFFTAVIFLWIEEWV